MAKEHKTSRFWTGDYEGTLHVFDGESKYPTVSRCGKADFDQMKDQMDTNCNTLLEFVTRFSPEMTCSNCRMSLAFEIWRARKATK